MKKFPAEYDYFHVALMSFAAKHGRSFQVSLSVSTKIAEPTISNIINKVRLANFGQQIKIAKALEYGYVEFLSLGRDLLSGKTPAFPVIDPEIILLEERVRRLEELTNDTGEDRRVVNGPPRPRGAKKER